jgi:uncharacterized protein (DUF2461 family)
MAAPARSSAGTPPPATAAFGGFPDEALLFYEGLEADNSRAYWTDHAEVYDRAVRAPMLALIAAVERSVTCASAPTSRRTRPMPLP